MREHSFTLSDGRILSYAVYGPDGGQTVLYFHGTPSSKLEPMLLKNYNNDVEQLLPKHNLKLLAIDRPGMGLSTYNPNGDFTSFSQDVNELITHLKINSCKVLCWSGGGPYALSIAYHYPEIIKEVHIVTGFTRSFNEPGVFKNMNGNKYYFWSARNIPFIMEKTMNFIGKKEAKRSIPKWLSGLPDVDHNLMNSRATISHVSKITLNEACRNGSKGMVHEAGLYFKETGYKLNKIVQPVHFWWGSKDNTVPEVHAKAVEEQVPNAIMHYKQNEGHLSIYVNWIEKVFETIAAGNAVN